jgi:hypothetical protein
MKWFKDVIVDVVVTALIVLAALQELEWASWLVLVYTPFMLFMKAVLFFGGGFLKQFKKKEVSAVPGWFLHLLYGLNVAVLLTAGWWLTALQWALIWGLSFAAELKARPHAKTA